MPTEEVQPDAPKPTKPKLTAREKRKLLAKKRKERIRRNDEDRLAYIQNRISKEKLIEKEKETAAQIVPESSTDDIASDSTDGERIGDAFNSQRTHPFMNNCNNSNDSIPSNPDLEHLHNLFSGGGLPEMAGMGGLGAMGGGLGGIPPMDPSMGIQGMMEQLLGTPNAANSKQIAEKRKKEEMIDRYDRYSHNALCLLFVALLVFLPDRYDPTIMRYSLSSDPWTFFMALEITLFAVVYGYKQYLQGQYERNQGSSSVELLISNEMEGGGQLMAMMGASMFGGGNAFQGMIKKWMERAMMIWSYIKMIRQLISDLCLVLFLWILFTAIKTLISS